MKKTAYYLLLPLLFLVFNFHAQDLDIKWSSKTKYSNCDDGYFDSFVGSNDKYVYGIYTEYRSPSFGSSRKKGKINLVAFEKSSMQKSYHAYLKDKKHDKKRFKKLQSFTYVTTLVIKNTVYVFWKKKSLTQTDVFAESFDSYLNTTGKLKKVYSVKHVASKKANRKMRRRERMGQSVGVPISIQSSRDSTNFMIGVEIEKEKNDPIEFDYAILDLDFKELNKGHVKLPVLPSSRFFALTNAFTYQYGKDGNIYIKGSVRLTPAERRNAQKGENSSYSILCVLDPVSAELETYTMKYDGVNVFNFDFTSDENGVKLYGFFNDLSKDSKGIKTHGIFYSSIKNGEMAEPHFSYFDAKTLTELFKEDPSEKLETGTLVLKRKKPEKINKEESLDESYVIEAAENLEDGHIVLFCTKVYNYTTITYSNIGGMGTAAAGFTGVGRSTVPSVNYYCRKSNVTAFKLDSEGEIVWASNLDREKTYSNWNVKDLKIIHNEEKFYVLYGSAFHTDSLRLSGKKSKKLKELRDEFEYGIFDYETGKPEKKSYVINGPSVGRKERKYVNPLEIMVFDNTFYVNSIKIKLRPSVIFLPLTFVLATTLIMAEHPALFITGVAAFAASFVAVPVTMNLYANGKIFKGSGHVGSIVLPETKGSK